ncbi:MAG TPA: hypothetical protein V6C78_25445, partial [Crinalium sp.]
MSIEKLLSTNGDGEAIAQSPRFRHLIDHAMHMLETALESNQLSEFERAQLAVQILELELQRGDRPSSTVQPAEEPLPELSDDWKGWIIENKLRQIPNENLIQTMIRDGIDADLATRAVHTIQIDPTFQQQHEAAQRLRKLESVLATQRKVSELSSNFGTIERRKDVSKEEFLEQYYTTNTPVILTDMLNDWPALSLWNPE